MVKKLAGIAVPALAICVLAALPLIGATTAYANAGASAAAVVTPTPTPDGNPWHG